MGDASNWQALRRKFSGDDVQQTYEVLDRVGIGGLDTNRADELSGGQRQRVGIARAVGIDAAVELVRNTFPPELTPRKRELLVESINMSIVATVLGILVSIPVGFMAAENLAPRSLYYVNRGIISVTRSFHELIVAILGVVIFSEAFSAYVRRKVR